MPVAPVNVDGTWYTGGWVGPSALSLALHVGTVGVEEAKTLDGRAFPNPATDNVTIAVNGNGDAQLTVTDIAGKVAMVDAVNFNNGTTNVSLDALAPGLYVFNIEMENGYSSQFNVVKK